MDLKKSKFNILIIHFLLIWVVVWIPYYPNVQKMLKKNQVVIQKSRQFHPFVHNESYLNGLKNPLLNPPKNVVNQKSVRQNPAAVKN